MSDEYENTLQRLKRKSIEQPWVPLGCALTVGSFLAAYSKFRQGSREQGIVLLRYRVAFQGLTVIGLLLGSAMAVSGKKDDKNNPILPPIKPLPVFEQRH